jgi:ribosomal protein L24E
MDNFFCSFCGIKIYPGHGSLLVKNTLKLFFFCRSKCRKLFNLKKNPLFFPWTISSRLNRGIALEIPEVEKNFSNKLLKTSKIYNQKILMQLIYNLKRQDWGGIKKVYDYNNKKKSPHKRLRDRAV